MILKDLGFHSISQDKTYRDYLFLKKYGQHSLSYTFAEEFLFDAKTKHKNTSNERRLKSKQTEQKNLIHFLNYFYAFILGLPLKFDCMWQKTRSRSFNCLPGVIFTNVLFLLESKDFA